MFVWFPSLLALAAVVFALAAGPVGSDKLDAWASRAGAETVSAPGAGATPPPPAAALPATDEVDGVGALAAADAPETARPRRFKGAPVAAPGSAPARPVAAGATGTAPTAPLPVGSAPAVAEAAAAPAPASDGAAPPESAATVKDAPAAAPTGRARGDAAQPGPELDAWALDLPGAHLDGVATRGEQLVAVTRIEGERPLIDPAVLRVAAIGADGSAAAAPWEAAVLGPSPVGLATSGAQALAAWSHRAHPGRELALLRVGVVPAEARHAIARPDDGAFAPSGQPVVAAAGDGAWLVCSASDVGAPRCAHVSASGEVRWATIASFAGAGTWRLEPQGDAFTLFGLACDRGDCRGPQLVAQALDAEGQPRGRRRVIARVQGHRALGVVPVAADALVFGRRLGVKASTAWLVRPGAARELDGRWNRTVGGVADEAGALLVEVDKLHMEAGLPVTGFRLRRYAAGEGREKPLPWPEGVSAQLPKGPEQLLVQGRGVFAIVGPGRGGRLRGVALRPAPSGASGIAAGPGPAAAAHP